MSSTNLLEDRCWPLSLSKVLDSVYHTRNCFQVLHSGKLLAFLTKTICLGSRQLKGSLALGSVQDAVSSTPKFLHLRAALAFYTSAPGTMRASFPLLHVSQISKCGNSEMGNMRDALFEVFSPAGFCDLPPCIPLLSSRTNEICGFGRQCFLEPLALYTCSCQLPQICIDLSCFRWFPFDQRLSISLKHVLHVWRVSGRNLLSRGPSLRSVSSCFRVAPMRR